MYCIYQIVWVVTKKDPAEGDTVGISGRRLRLGELVWRVYPAAKEIGYV